MPARTLNDFFVGFFISNSAEKGLSHGTTKKAWKVPCLKTKPFKASKIL